MFLTLLESRDLRSLLLKISTDLPLGHVIDGSDTAENKTREGHPAAAITCIGPVSLPTAEIEPRASDAISAISIPTIEVHLSDIKSREKFRQTSVIQDVCLEQISGLGKNGYLEAIYALEKYLNR